MKRTPDEGGDVIRLLIQGVSVKSGQNLLTQIFGVVHETPITAADRECFLVISFSYCKGQMTHYPIERKRAAVDVYWRATTLRNEHAAPWLHPLDLASVAAGGASRTRIYEWLRTDLSVEAQEQREEARGSSSLLNEDQQRLLVGFSCSTRSCLLALDLKRLTDFCNSHFAETPSRSTLSRIMSEHGVTSQMALSRNSRMVSPQVVEDALDFIAEIREYELPDHRLLFMDETGLWSNVAKPRTYHFKNWSDFSISSRFSSVLRSH